VSIRGSVDVVTTKGAVGWAYAQGRREDIMVQAVLGHEVIGDAVATTHRPDLAAVGMGKGNCGYTIKFYREIDPLYLPFISVKVDGGDIELPRPGYLGFAEFFAAFYRAHPAAGRARSMLGGLWTDRTDAAAILKSKIDISQVTGEAAASIRPLIHLGLAVLSLGRSGIALDEAGAPSAEWIASIVEQPALLTTLRSVLDDNPCVLNVEICASDTALIQPSAEYHLPSAAECLAVVMPAVEQGIAIDVVRDSHRLPEFTTAGISRWASGETHAGLEIAAQRQGLITRYDVPLGSIAIIGPGTIYRLHAAKGAEALKFCCIPSRTIPMALTKDGTSRPSRS